KNHYNCSLVIFGYQKGFRRRMIGTTYKSKKQKIPNTSKFTFHKKIFHQLPVVLVPIILSLLSKCIVVSIVDIGLSLFPGKDITGPVLGPALGWEDPSKTLLPLWSVI